MLHASHTNKQLTALRFGEHVLHADKVGRVTQTWYSAREPAYRRKKDLKHHESPASRIFTVWCHSCKYS